MKKPVIFFFAIFILLAFMAYLINFISLSTPISLPLVKQILHGVIVLLGALATIRFFNHFLWPYMGQKTGRVISPVIANVTTLIFIFLAFLLIVVGIFDQPLTGILAASGLITAALALSLKNILLDIFSAFIIDVDRPFKVGDWIKIKGKEKIQGEVIHISWRHTEILTHENTIVYVPNGDLIKEPIINFTRASGWHLETLEITLDHNVPVARVRRIVHAALFKIPEIIGHHSAVYAHQPEEGGIVYVVCYAISTPKIWRSIRHKAIDEITTQLHRYNLKISQFLGEYVDFEFPTTESGEIIKETPPLGAKEALEKVDIFASLAKTQLTKSLQIRHIPQGEIVINKGEKDYSLFIIAEGVAEVQLTDTDSEYLHEGDYVGERGLLLGEPRAATVKAKTDLILYKLEKKDLEPILKKNPQIVEAIAHVLTLRYEELMKAQKAAKKGYERTSFKESLISLIKDFFSMK